MRICKHYIPWKLLVLVVAEGAILFASVYAGAALGYLGGPELWLGFEPIYPKALLLTLVSWLTFYVANLYDLRLYRRKRELLLTLVACFAVIAGVVAALSFLVPPLRLSRTAYLVSLAVSLPAVVGFRLLYYWLINTRQLREKVLIVGDSEVAQRLLAELHHETHPGVEVLGVVTPQAPRHLLPGVRVLGRIDELERLVRERKPDVLVVALTERRGAFPTKQILQCKLQGVRVEDWPSFYEKLTGKILVHALRPSWLIFADGFTRTKLTRTLKRLTDVTLATFGLTVSLPLIGLIALLTKLDSAGPVFFRQERVGENGKIFTLYKFRTMVVDAEKETGPVWAQQHDPRVTRLGRLLRRTGMDELPQLFNVLKGDMSFVGPRPERPHFVAELQEKIPYYAQRLTVKPGITGWAQVRYGYGATLEDAVEKLQYDLYYIKNMSFFLDLLVLLSTIHKVLFARVAVPTPPARPPLPAATGDEAAWAGMQVAPSLDQRLSS
ncbi:MAG: glycosyl transferase [Candidatus Tectimicrobiota bacterium]|nr:MAG: glycosyl transferase [Candidatus Tectomicrobia bacterium]